MEDVTQLDKCLPRVCEALGSFALLYYIKLGVMVTSVISEGLVAQGHLWLHISLRPGWVQRDPVSKSDVDNKNPNMKLVKPECKAMSANWKTACGRPGSRRWPLCWGPALLLGFL